MDTKSDFGLSLVAALRATRKSSDNAVFVKAALALRAWYRHEVLRNKPELVVQHTAEVFELYGGLKLERNADGTLQLHHGQKPAYLSNIELSSIGRHLAEEARKAIRKVYHDKARDYLKQQTLPEEFEELRVVLADVADYCGRLNVAWWRRKSSLAIDTRVLSRLLWDSGMLDREVFSLATRVAGFRFSVGTYNCCMQQRAELAARVKEAPNMAPWLYDATTAYGESSALRTHPTVWRDLKERFMTLGGTAQAWKWLCGQGHTWFRFTPLCEEHVATITGIASLQLGKVPLHKGLVSAMFTTYPTLPWRMGEPRVLDVFKAAIVANKKRKLKVAEFEDYVLIFDYLRRVPTANTKGATWTSLMRKQAVWHREEAARAAAQRKASNRCVSWMPLVQSIQLAGLEAVSLNNSDELWEEGDAMQHCVGGYDHNCYHNTSRIYSLRRDGLRVATLEIRRNGERWTIGQLYGPGNTKVADVAVQKLAQQVLVACQKALPLSLDDNTVVREPVRDKPTPRARAPRQIHAEDADALLPF